VGELVYGRVTKLVPFGAFVQVGDGIEGLVHISEMAVHHVDQPDQVVSPGEELWVKIIDIDLARRRISLSIKQAAEGGEVAAEYREAFGEHAYDEHGNYIGAGYTPFEPESEAQAAWAGYLEEQAHGAGATPGAGEAGDAGVTGEAGAAAGTTPAGTGAASAVPRAPAGAELAAGPEVTEIVEIVEIGRDEAGEPEVLGIVEEVDAAGNAEVEVDEVVMGTTPGAPAPATTPEPGAGTAPAG
jgi:small subunit ribosomal protein S1